MRRTWVLGGCAALAIAAALSFSIATGRLTAEPLDAGRRWLGARSGWLAAWLLLPVAAAPTPAPVIPVKVAPVAVADVPINLMVIGTVQATNTVAVKTRVDGEINRILFTEGQDVHQGDPLVLIDPRPLQAQFQQQEAAHVKDQALLAGALLDMKRYDELVQRDSVTRQQVDQEHALVDQYRAQVKADEAQIDYARAELDYTTIRAPLDGRVGIRQVDQGNIVHAADNTTIVTVTQLQPISVVFTVAAVALESTRLSLGQVHAPVVALAGDGKTVLDRGSVDLVDTQVDQATGTIKLKASFSNTAVRLWPGNFVNGQITVDQRHDGLTVPAVAVRHGPYGDFVWLVGANDTVRSHRVTVGSAVDDRILIDQGVAPGDRVVIDGYYRLDDGVRVSIEAAPPPAEEKPAAASPAAKPAAPGTPARPKPPAAAKPAPTAPTAAKPAAAP
ncbi:MAG: efflux RND transporter periplasmic adaptor subunit [Azospirillaceae bacterium]|nr:efflux RND transporter periplasmic adaptor subunit [Azospirillaceae bacterium]